MADTPETTPRLRRRLGLRLRKAAYSTPGLRRLLTKTPKTPSIEPTQVEATEVEATQVEATQVEPAHVEATRIEATEVEATQVEATQVEATQVEPTHVAATRIEATKVETTQIESTKVEAEVPDQTPRTFPQELKAKANSTSGRRVGLTRLRKNVSKKRLEFTETEPAKKPVKVNRPKSPRKTQGRERQIIELIADIETWRKGFRAALADLQSLLEPQYSHHSHVSKKALLQQLEIPLEMLQYLDDD